MTRRFRLLLLADIAVVVGAVLVSVLLIHDRGGADGLSVGSVDELASQVGCSTFDKEPEPGPVAQVAGSGTCVASGETLRLSYFSSRADRDVFAEQTSGIAEIVGPEAGSTLIGENWAVTARTEEALTAVQERLGGALVE